jgi:hypothetical protein
MSGGASEVYGMLAEFEQPEALARAAAGMRGVGYRELDCFTPFPVEGVEETLGIGETRLPWLAAGAALLGVVLGYLLQWYASAVHYPINVGGRPLAAWPAFTLPALLSGALLGALVAMAVMLVMNRLPRRDHPLVRSEAFRRASRDRFYLLVRATDPRYEPARTRELLEGLRATTITEVPP